MANDTVPVAPGGDDPRVGVPECQEPSVPPSDRIAVVINGNAKRVND